MKEDTTFCTNCGKEILKIAKFCNFCGTQQGATSEQKTEISKEISNQEKAVTPKPISSKKTKQESQKVKKTIPSRASKSKKKASKVVPAVIVGILVLGAGAAWTTYTHFNHLTLLGKANEKSSDTSSITNKIKQFDDEEKGSISDDFARYVSDKNLKKGQSLIIPSPSLKLHGASSAYVETDDHQKIQVASSKNNNSNSGLQSLGGRKSEGSSGVLLAYTDIHGKNSIQQNNNQVQQNPDWAKNVNKSKESTYYVLADDGNVYSTKVTKGTPEIYGYKTGKSQQKPKVKFSKASKEIQKGYKQSIKKQIKNQELEKLLLKNHKKAKNLTENQVISISNEFAKFLKNEVSPNGESVTTPLPFSHYQFYANVFVETKSGNKIQADYSSYQNPNLSKLYSKHTLGFIKKRNDKNDERNYFGEYYVYSDKRGVRKLNQLFSDGVLYSYESGKYIDFSKPSSNYVLCDDGYVYVVSRKKGFSSAYGYNTPTKKEAKKFGFYDDEYKEFQKWSSGQEPKETFVKADIKAQNEYQKLIKKYEKYPNKRISLCTLDNMTMDLPAISAGDYSSIEGMWKSKSGQTIVVTKNSLSFSPALYGTVKKFTYGQLDDDGNKWGTDIDYQDNGTLALNSLISFGPKGTVVSKKDSVNPGLVLKEDGIWICNGVPRQEDIAYKVSK